MKKSIVFSILFVLAVCFSSAQNATKAPATGLSAEQKNYLANTWYESPKESTPDQIVYRLTEYVMVVGLDYYNTPPGKIMLDNANRFKAEYVKACTSEPSMNTEGKWSLSGNSVVLNFGKQKCKQTILEIEKGKLVLLVK